MQSCAMQGQCAELRQDDMHSIKANTNAQADTANFCRKREAQAMHDDMREDDGWRKPTGA